MKIAIIEKIESARRTMGRRKNAPLFSLPVVPRALSFSLSPASPQHKEASAEERVSVPLTDSSFAPSDQHQFSPINVNRETGWQRSFP